MKPFLWIVLCTAAIGFVSTSADLLKNPSFDDELASWYHEVWEGASTVEVMGSADSFRYLKVAVSDPGTALWNIELQQHDVKFQGLAAYKLTARMKCDKKRPVGFAFVDADTNKEEAVVKVICGGSEGVNCINGYCDYTGEFLPDKDYNGRIKLQFGGSAVTAFVDAVTLTEKPRRTPPPAGRANPGFSVPCDGGDAAWEETFSDEFNGDMDDVRKEWSLYDSPGHAGNGIRSPNAFSCAEGKLTITARKENGVTVSGGMSCNTRQHYGCYVVRARTDNDPSESLSGVVLTWPERYPDGGENDWYETLSNGVRKPFYSFFHSSTVLPQAYMEHKEYDASEWHEVAMMWTPDVIKVYIDGKFMDQTTDQRFIPTNTDNLHYIAIQLDAKNKNDLGTNVVKMEVDWIRMYKQK